MYVLPVKVHFERTGGFAGMHMSVVLDTDKMSQTESEKIHMMCDNIGFFKLPAKTESKGDVVDTFHYKITIESKNTVHTVETNELAMTPEFTDFVNFLYEKAIQK